MSLNVAGIGPAGIDPQVAALAPSQLAERLCQRGEPGLPLGIVRGDIREHADAPHPLALLRARRERPRGPAGERGYEVSSSNAACHVTPPVGGHSCHGGMIPRFHRAVSDYCRAPPVLTLAAKFRKPLAITRAAKSVLNGSRGFHRSALVISARASSLARKLAP